MMDITQIKNYLKENFDYEDPITDINLRYSEDRIYIEINGKPTDLDVHMSNIADQLGVDLETSIVSNVMDYPSRFDRHQQAEKYEIVYEDAEYQFTSFTEEEIIESMLSFIIDGAS